MTSQVASPTTTAATTIRITATPTTTIKEELFPPDTGKKNNTNITNSKEKKVEVAAAAAAAAVGTTIGPITDIASTSPQTDTPTVHNHALNDTTQGASGVRHTSLVERPKKPANSNSNSNSKIPHPLAALLASKTNQFRRSASVRMRGSKSNFLFNTFNGRDGCNCNCNCTVNNNHNNNSSNKFNYSLRHRVYKKMEQQQQQRSCNNSALPDSDVKATTFDQVTHELATAACVSPRRKLILSSPQQTSSIDSPRSSSLSRAQNQNLNPSPNQIQNQTQNPHKNQNKPQNWYKTEARTELCSLELDRKVQPPQHNNNEENVKPKTQQQQQDFSSSSSLSTATDSVISVACTVSTNVVQAASTKTKLEKPGNPVSENGSGIRRREEHNNKMSLNFNGSQTSVAQPVTTTTKTTATTTTTAAAGIAATNVVRPTSLTTALPAATETGTATAATTVENITNSTTTATATTSSKLTTKFKASPKTPKTPLNRVGQQQGQGQQQQQSTNSQHCSQHQHCLLKHQQQQQAPLPAVLETAKPTPRTPPVTPDSPSNYLEDDIDSLYSFATTTSGRSTMSCEHPYVACNGTTFSGRKMKYVVHCSNYAGQVGADYLTPTQRAQRQIRRLKDLLCVARQDLEQKDSEILGLTREVVELRLFKASLSSPEDRSASSDAVTVREAELKTSQDVSPIVDMIDDVTKSSPHNLTDHHHLHHHHHHHHQQQLQLKQNTLHLSTSEMQSSFADSGHFEDMTTSSVHSKDSYVTHTHDMACGRDVPPGDGGLDDGEDEDDDDDADVDVDVDEVRQGDSYELQRQKLIRLYEQRIEELIRTQDTASSEVKRSHNDRVEALLQKLAECNTRYADLVPDYEHAKERIRELEKQLEDLQRKLVEHEEKQNKMYLHMYQKGQEAERISRADQALELAHRAPNNKVSINELLHQLQSTQDELENIRAAECRKETGGNHALLTAKEAVSLWVLGARKTIYRRLLEAQKNRTHVDPEVTLQFLKSAIYYFLTDKENSQGHLQAIESILEFTEAEKRSICKARSPK